ncbi:hypothetical protein [Vitreimonas sp.]|jgi:uncharacterized membrane protein|uniref:hypothetical protein n=1 Tax=Vitreimonas sp. TaxID=3069702 RepID=UPI002ED8DDCB
MSHDNVTPFRRPKPARPQQSGGLGFKTHRGKVVLVHLLTIVAFALNFILRMPPWSLIGTAVGLAAIALAYTNRGQGMPWVNTHHEHAVRTLVIGYAVWVLGAVLPMAYAPLVVATFFIQLAAAIWAGLRALIALVLAVMRKPIPNPHGWLV